jgi:hypothetical protein
MTESSAFYSQECKTDDNPTDTPEHSSTYREKIRGRYQVFQDKISKKDIM